MVDRGFCSRQSANCVNNSNNSSRRPSSARESSILRTMTAVTKRTALQAIAVRVFLVIITLTMIIFATRTTGKKRDLYLFAFLLPPLAELGFALQKIVVKHSDQAGFRLCLLTFLISVCPAVCVMEQFQMQDRRHWNTRVYDDKTCWWLWTYPTWVPVDGPEKYRLANYMGYKPATQAKANMGGSSPDQWTFTRVVSGTSDCRKKEEYVHYPPLKTAVRAVELLPFLAASIVRWMLPHSAFSYHQLPPLLLINLCSASDIYEIFELIDEPLSDVVDLWLMVLFIWPASLFNLYLKNTLRVDSRVTLRLRNLQTLDQVDSGQHNLLRGSVALDTNQNNDLRGSKSEAIGKSDAPQETDAELTHSAQRKCCHDLGPVRKGCCHCSGPLEHFFGVELWVILGPVLLQDVPFLFWRYKFNFYFDVYSARIYFYTMKNLIFILIHVFQAFVMLRRALLAKLVEAEPKAAPSFSLIV